MKEVKGGRWYNLITDHHVVADTATLFNYILYLFSHRKDFLYLIDKSACFQEGHNQDFWLPLWSTNLKKRSLLRKTLPISFYKFCLTIPVQIQDTSAVLLSKSLHQCKYYIQVIICHQAKLLRAYYNRYGACRGRKILSLINVAVETPISMHRNTIQQRWNLTDWFLSDRKTILLDHCFSAADPESNGRLWDIWNSPWNSCKEGWLVFWVGGEEKGIVFLFLYFQ